MYGFHSECDESKLLRVKQDRSQVPSESALAVRLRVGVGKFKSDYMLESLSVAGST